MSKGGYPQQITAWRTSDGRLFGLMNKAFLHQVAMDYAAQEEANPDLWKAGLTRLQNLSRFHNI